MPELFRMRVTRAVQRRELPSDQMYRVLANRRGIARLGLEAAGGILLRAGLAKPSYRLVTPIFNPLPGDEAAAAIDQQKFRHVTDLDVWLNRNRDQPSGEALRTMLVSQLEQPLRQEPAEPAEPDGAAIAAAWLEQHAVQADEYGRMLFALFEFSSPPPDTCVHLTRIASVFGMVDALAKSPDPGRFGERTVLRALRDRLVVVPPFDDSPRWPFVVTMGCADLFIVRSEWVRYVPGEVADTEPLMPFEHKKRRMVRTDQTVTTAIKDTTTVTQDLTDARVTDRSQQQDTAQKDVSDSLHADGQVDMSTSYGPMSLDTHFGLSLDHSESDSTQHATTQAHETVSRTVKSLQTTVREARITTVLSRTVETDQHEQNNQTADSLNSIYQWVNKVERYQVFRYNHRLTLEFLVPEPAAWVTWLKGQTPQDVGVDVPPDFTKLANADADEATAFRATDITEVNYVQLGAKVRASGLEAPPPRIVRVVGQWELKPYDPHSPADDPNKAVDTVRQHSPVQAYKLDTPIVVPSGYDAVRYFIRYEAWGDSAWWGNGNPHITARLGVMVGNSTHDFYSANDMGSMSNELDGANQKVAAGPFDTRYVNDPDPGIPADPANPRYSDPTVLTGSRTLPVSVLTDNMRTYILHIEVDCERTDASFADWQNSIFDLLSDAWQTWNRQYQAALRAASISQGVTIDGASPERNKQVVAGELKKLVIGLLYGDATGTDDVPFTWRDLVLKGDKNEPLPQGDLDGMAMAELAAQRARTAFFLQRAFEWEHMSFVLYSYEYADRSRWPALASAAGTDADYDNFLRSGAARVAVPARPGFEAHVRCFVKHGVLWSGGKVPGPDDPGYISVAQEIQAMQDQTDRGTPLGSWEEVLPTTELWLSGGQPLPERPEGEIGLDPPPGFPDH